MFGMGFTEIILVIIVAIIFLGPEKLPSALVDIAKMFRSVKKQVAEAKGALEDELKMDELTSIKSEALDYKKSLEKEMNEISEEAEMESREVRDIWAELAEQNESAKKEKEMKKTASAPKAEEPVPEAPKSEEPAKKDESKDA